MKSAPNLIFIGPTGAGKSCIGHQLSSQIDFDFVDSDTLIETQLGMSMNEIFAQYGEQGFRAVECAQLSALLAKERKIIATGSGAVLNESLRRAIQRHGYVIYLTVSIKTQIARLAKDQTRPLIMVADRSLVLAQMDRVRSPLYREIADLTLHTDTLSITDAASLLQNKIASHWTPSTTTQSP